MPIFSLKLPVYSGPVFQRAHDNVLGQKTAVFRQSYHNTDQPQAGQKIQFAIDADS